MIFRVIFRHAINDMKPYFDYYSLRHQDEYNGMCLIFDFHFSVIRIVVKAAQVFANNGDAMSFAENNTVKRKPAATS